MFVPVRTRAYMRRRRHVYVYIHAHMRICPSGEFVVSSRLKGSRVSPGFREIGRAIPFYLFCFLSSPKVHRIRYAVNSHDGHDREKTRHAPSAEFAGFAYKFRSGPTDIENAGEKTRPKRYCCLGEGGRSVDETLSSQCRRVCHKPNVCCDDIPVGHENRSVDTERTMCFKYFVGRGC